MPDNRKKRKEIVAEDVPAEKKMRSGSESTQGSGQVSSISGIGAGVHSQSPGSSDMAVTGQLNQRLIVDMREVTDESGNKRIELAIADRRPPTHLGGNKQGDHVTAYVAYLHMLITAVEGESMQKAASIITEAAKAILPDKAEIFTEVLRNLQDPISKVFTKSERRKVIGIMKDSGLFATDEIDKTNETFKRDKAAVFMNVTKQVCQKFLEEVNLDEEIAFARVGSVAGAKEKKAIHTLKVINELEGIDPKATQEEKVDKFDRLYTCCIKTSAPYIIGMNNVFRGLDAAEIRMTWACVGDDPKIKEQRLYELYESYHRAMGEKDLGRSGYNTRSSSSSEAQPNTKISLISECFCDLFDFKYEVHQSDSEELIYRVVARHIVCMFRAFDKLQLFENGMKGQVIDKFLVDGVLNKQGWRNHEVATQSTFSKLSLPIIRNEMEKNMDLTKFEMLPSERSALLQMGMFRGAISSARKIDRGV